MVWLEERMDSIWRSVTNPLKLAAGIRETQNSTSEDEHSNRQADGELPSGIKVSTDATFREASSQIGKVETTKEDTLRASRVLDKQPDLQAGDAAAEPDRSKWNSIFDLASFRVYRLTDVDNALSRPIRQEKSGRQAVAGFADANRSLPIVATDLRHDYHRIEYDMTTDASRALYE